MILSGDDLTRLDADRLDLLRKLLPPTGVAARFADAELGVGAAELADRRLVFLLNQDDAPRTRSFRFDRPCRSRELWTGEDLGAREGEVTLTLPARAGRVVVCMREA
jgi:alpha-galactosidase